jgi:hypothetical protein
MPGEAERAGSTSRLAYYSVTFLDAAREAELLWQLETSVASLRAFNDRLTVVVFVYGCVPDGLHDIAARCGVHVVRVEPYRDRLARLCPDGWRLLADYPLLHKFLNFGRLAQLAGEPDQVLYLDCDTFFFGDVERLFDAYAIAHVVAREEVSCGRSHYGYDPEYLDEAQIASVAGATGSQPPPPFNLGVVLFNAGAWRLLPPLEPTLLDYARRLATWMAMHPAVGRSAEYGEFLGVDQLRRSGALTSSDARAALPYPSANRWLLDELALWLTLGHVPGLTSADFSRTDVMQNGELDTSRDDTGDAVLCHYFSQSTERVREWTLRRQLINTP